MNKFSRAQRRADYRRLKNKRKNHWGYGTNGWRGYWEHGLEVMSKRQAGMVVNTPAPCSCWMCCNPRHSYMEKTLTRQELKAKDSFKDGVAEYFNDDGGLDDSWLFSEMMKEEYYNDYYEIAHDDFTEWYLRGLYYRSR